jgi:serine/threonine protein kinase
VNAEENSHAPEQGAEQFSRHLPKTPIRFSGEGLRRVGTVERGAGENRVSAFVRQSEHLKGLRLGGYELVRLIGHGATASVYEAVHVALGKPVAIKVLHEHLAGDEQLQSRFVREGRAAARLNHPNTVDVLDVGLESGVPYLVMELLTGGDLRTLLAEVQILTVEHALSFLLPIASALAQAHDQGVLHRDLKPANIFLARDMRGDIVPKLVDFGLSKIERDDGSSALTALDLVAGTALYMAPEQTLGVRNSTPASDQYSLAVILYECLTGEAPFMADSVYALLERIRADVVRPPSQQNPRVPSALDAVILRALERDPTQRFATIRAFARALVPFAEAETVRPLERDFLDRASAATPAASSTSSSRPSIRKATAEAETRIEQHPFPSSSPPPSAREAATSTSAIRASASLRGSVRSSSPAVPLPTLPSPRLPAPAVPPLPCSAGTSPFRIKGLSYRGFITLLNRVLPAGLDAFCEALPDESLRAFVRQPFLASGRYDILPMLPLYATLAELLATDMDGLVREATVAQCRYDAQTVFKAIWSNGTVESIAERIARFGARYYDFGWLSATIPEPNLLVLVHAGVPAYLRPWYEPMHVAYTEECMRIFGAESVVSTPRGTIADGKFGDFALIKTCTELRWLARDWP